MNFLDMPIQAPSLADPKEKVWSSLQEAIFDAGRSTDAPLIIQAVAGSGKTTTLMELTQHIAQPAIFLAFNKAIAEDIRGKLPCGEARTLNSLGHRLWMQNAAGSRLDFDKLDKLLDNLDRDTKWKYGYTVKRIVGTAKANGIGIIHPATPQIFLELIRNGEWDLAADEMQKVAVISSKIFFASVTDDSTFDFDDQIFGPIYHGWSFPSFASVLVDEAQDLNFIQHSFCAELVRAGARLFAVGDRHQAIYAFRGALHDSMDRLKAKFQMSEFPLSISYRCPLAVIREAQALVPHIQARDGAPQGEVLDQMKLLHEDELDYPAAIDPELFPDDWLVICRNNAPLFSAVMRHVRARKPCRVLSNSLEGLSGFIKKFRANDIPSLLAKLERWLDKERLAAEANGMAWKVAALEDKAATVQALCEGFQSVEQVLSLLKQLSEGKSGPIFSTIHKAKGLEADHVYFLRPDLVPAWWVRDDAGIQQELNLRYVAITRAKQTLTYGVRKERR